MQPVGSEGKLWLHQGGWCLSQCIHQAPQENIVLPLSSWGHSALFLFPASGQPSKELPVCIRDLQGSHQEIIPEHKAAGFRTSILRDVFGMGLNCEREGKKCHIHL